MRLEELCWFFALGRAGPLAQVVDDHSYIFKRGERVSLNVHDWQVLPQSNVASQFLFLSLAFPFRQMARRQNFRPRVVFVRGATDANRVNTLLSNNKKASSGKAAFASRRSIASLPSTLH